MRELTVVMSTYNGEKYISEQIESIMHQRGISPFLLIRDDGSTDGTLYEAKKLQKDYPDRIDIIKGSNVGYRESFLIALSNAPDSLFYAFADQDDVWLEEKCESGIEQLKNINRQGRLYASSLHICNEMLSEVNFSDITTSPNTIMSFFIRHRMAGCTMMFDNYLKKIVDDIFIGGGYKEQSY